MRVFALLWQYLKQPMRYLVTTFLGVTEQKMRWPFRKPTVINARSSREAPGVVAFELG